MITLDQVRSFVAVAEELHFGRAAERLQMTQPPLSRQIQKLERSIGAQLLERDNRRVVLTGAGEAFLDEAYRMLNLVDSAGDLARRVDAGAAGVVRLGFTAVSAISILGPLLRRLTAELPDVEVRLSERVTNAQVDGIRRGELDIGLARPPFDTALLSSRVILREPLMAVVPEAHRFASLGRPLTPRDFEGEAVIGYHPQQSRYFHELVVRFLANAHPRIEQRVHQVLTAMLLVAAERGLALAPASATSLHVEGVVFKELDHHGGDTRLDADPERPVELHAIWARDVASPVVRRVLGVIADVVE
ncbi:LysR family transcriptional regulator [Nocardioides sp. YIM 152315]|uniref:LysR family transcriptional regulator n=1 Tax=Nocardioides sp. YIM 152315 TaxID=3031760 RepID=UPI0023DAC39F|nr:LysR family transcriptional regulator [Nocardioides sp. YIM 152315]MDF1605120.1 LysR family transcriptional regulator [Nocardioides sp. YIM 152315]